MKHNELLDIIDKPTPFGGNDHPYIYIRVDELLKFRKALRDVIELHKPELDGLICKECTGSESVWYPCETIEAIEKVLK